MRIILISLFAVFLLIACGGDEPAQNDGEVKPGTQPGTQPGDPAPAQPPVAPPPPPPTPAPKPDTAEEFLKKVESKLASGDEDIRLEALELLMDIEDKSEAGRLATTLFSDPSSDVREIAVRMLADLDYKRGSDDLRSLLGREKNSLVRKVAVQTLYGLIGNKCARDLIDIIDRSGEESSVKAIAASLLGQTDHELAGPALIRALGQIDTTTRVNALVGIQKLKPDRAVDPVIDLLEDMDPSVCVEAARTLGVLGDKKAIPQLMRLFDDESNVGTFQAATDALSKLTGVTNKYDYNGSEEERTAALKAWKDWWKENQ